MANEKRLIDANALTKFLEDTTEEVDWLVSQFSADWIDCWIECAPTVDAVEVVHAYWIGEEPGDWHCSHCGEYAADGGYEQTRYCPNCGAKMDGDGNG